MDREITTLPLVTVNSGISTYSPDPDSAFVKENDPAERVMTDFKKVVPITVEPIVGIDLALNKMKTAGVRLLFVTDEQDHIAGVITSYDIQGEKPVKYSQEHGISHHLILVEMIMVPLEQIPAFDYDFVQQSLVRHVITTIQELERPYALVVEIDSHNGRQTIRGLFSSSQISKLVGKHIYKPLHVANSLAGIQQELVHNQ